ncbi:MAG: hypothetical protein EZS28_040839 [Streblomastix strix]|uniref:Uncharacterized protein n=1 Tax=Streblomastix strix TaxID=222440 RepID=A0A5J4U1X2_9EUKA|nr:MAG: hypothetical protein EZS28_040839 [Streblomastix strix]
MNRVIMPKLKQKQLPKFQNPKLCPKEVRKQLKRQNPNQKSQKKRVKRSRIPDRAGTLQPRKISVEISLGNRGEERADDKGSSGNGRKDWRIDIQRERQRNGVQDLKVYIGMETNRKRRIYKYRILSEIQRLKQLIKIRRKQNDNPIQRNIRGEESISRNVEGKIGKRDSNTYIIRPSEMVESYILDNETQWNMVKDFGCEQVEQGNREITFQNAWTRGSIVSSKLNGICIIFRSQISISPHHSIPKLNIIPSIQFQQQQLRIQSNAIWDQTKPNLLRGSNRINPQTNKNTFGNQDSELLRRHTSNPSRQTNTQNTNNGNNENTGIVRMDNFNGQMRDRTEIDNNISGIDMEFERNEYKNVGRKKVKDDKSIKGLVQHNIQEQERVDKTTSSSDWQIELSETSDKGSFSISNRIRQNENSSVKDGIMGWNNDSKQSSIKEIEMVDKEYS